MLAIHKPNHETSALPALQAPSSSSSLRLAGIVGILAAILVGIADIVLLYTPSGGYGSGSYDYLTAISRERLMLGHILGVLALPFEIAGLWQASQAMAIGARKTALAFLLVGAFSVVMGTVYHAALAPIAVLVQARDAASGETAAVINTLITEIPVYARSLASFMNYGVLFISIAFGWAVGFRSTLYPRWMAIFNPLVIFIAVVLLGNTLPVIGNFILPATFSITNLIFFGLSTVLTWNARSA